MAVIQVKTPSGEIVDVTISGDEPTEKEEKTIMERFFSDEAQRSALKDEEEQPSIPSDEIDYATGVGSDSLRYFFGRADNDNERRLELLSAGIPEEGFFQDDQGEFILDLDKIPEDVKTEYNLKSEEGRTKLAIDEAGFSWEDIVDFGGEALTPILAGTAAAFVVGTGGLGAIPLILAGGAVGGASGLGYLLDESIDYARGTFDQSTGETAKGLFYEVALGFGGEIAGRGLARILGRLFKGPGGIDAEQTRDLARGILTGEVDSSTGRLVSGRPTLRAANTAPLLGRAQAFYEGVFPNAGIARKNAKYLETSYRNLLKDLGIGEEQAKQTSGDFLAALLRDVDKMYSSPEQLAKEANKRLKNTIDTEIDSLIKRFGDPSLASTGDAAKSIQVVKRSFDEDVDWLYKISEDLMGKDARIIPTESLKGMLRGIIKKHGVTGEEIEKSALGKYISGLDKNGATPSAINSLRTALREATYDPSLIGTTDRKILTQLLTKVDESLNQAEGALLESNRPQTWSGVIGGVAVKGRQGFVKRAEIAKLENQKHALEALRRANTFYRNGISRFDTLYAKRITEGVRSGNEFADPDMILEYLVTPNRGTHLTNFLNAARPTPRIGLGGKEVFPVREGPKSWLDLVPNTKIETPQQLVDQGLPKIINLKKAVEANPDDPLALFYKRRFNEQTKFAAEIAEARTAGVSYKNAVRENLARRWMEGTINDPDVINVFGRVDPLKVVNKVRGLGSTGKVLFGDQYEPLMRSMGELSLVGEEVSQAELRAFAGRPITEQIESVTKLTQQVEDLKGIPFLRSLETAARSGETDKVISLVTRNKDTIRQAQQYLGKDSEAMGQIKDQLLVKVLSSIGDESSTITTRRTMLGGTRAERSLSPEFIKDVMSGKKHDQIMKAINSIGRDKMEMLFGKDTIDAFTTLARKAEAVSMRPLKGLGGLETASIARALTMGAMFVAPIQVLGSVLGLKAMGKVLRSKSYLDMVTRPTGDMTTAKNLEKALTLAWESSALSGPRLIAEQSGEQETVRRRNIQDYMNRVNTGMPRTKSRPTPAGAPALRQPIQRQMAPRVQTPFYNPAAHSGGATASAVERERVRRQIMGLTPQ